MSTTKYQLLHRYINEGTNTAITNSMDSKYAEAMEFYTDPDHMMFSTNEKDKAAAIDAQQAMISEGNSADNPKVNMIFAYDGTKKIKHKKWIPEATGYIVRDYTKIDRSKIGNRDDFSKEFTTIDKATPEDGGTVICTKTVFDKYFPATIIVATDNSGSDAGTANNPYFSEAKMNTMITSSTFFKLSTGGYKDHASPSNKETNYFGLPFYSGPVAIGGNNMKINTISTRFDSYTLFSQESDETHLYKDVTVKPTQVVTGTIPGHYEEVNSYPYLIKDTYKRIQLSPWFVNCTTTSLDVAIAKAKILVDMVGLDNVKLIKLVPFGQFVKIK